MVRDFDPGIVFRNIQNGRETFTLAGLPAFAQQALAFFSTRKQTIKSVSHNGTFTEVDIGYSAIWAIDVPNLASKGDQLELTGKSIFEFREGKIVPLTDTS